MSTMITRRGFMRMASTAALAGCGLMLTGCDLVGSLVDQAISMAYSDSISLGKYKVAGATADRFINSNDSDGNITDVTIQVGVYVFHADDELNGKSSDAFISNVTIDGKAIAVSNGETIKVDETELLGSTFAVAKLDVVFPVTNDQYYAYTENGKELKFTVTLAGKSAVYTLTYDKSKENSGYSSPVTSKVSKS